MESLVAQELVRRQCIAGIEDPEALWYWASKENEIDFVDARENLYEVKAGRSGPLDFAWFAKALPKRKLGRLKVLSVEIITKLAIFRADEAMILQCK